MFSKRDGRTRSVCQGSQGAHLRVPGWYTGWEAVGVWESEESSRIKETSNQLEGIRSAGESLWAIARALRL